MSDFPKFNKFNKLLKKMDLYGLNFPLRYKGKHEYNTLCGETLSIFTIIGIIIIVILFLIQSLARIRVSIIKNSEQLYEKKLLNFTRIPILIGFVNDGGVPVTIDPKYMSITLDKNDHYPEKNNEGIMHLRRESTPIKLEYCDLNKHFYNDSELIKMIDDFEYQNYLCAVPGQNLSIAGRYGDSFNGYDILEIHLIKCDNSSNNLSCASEDELNQFYKNSYLSILYLSETLNHYDTKNPIRKTFRSEVFMVVSHSVKRYYYYFAPGEYFSDNGYLFLESKKYFFFEYTKTDLDFVEVEDQSYYSNATIIEVAFSSMDLFVSYSRKYEKIQDCFGSIAGWIRIIYTIAKGISDFFSNKIFLLKVVNNIFIPNNKFNNNQKTSFFNSNFKNEFDNIDIKRNNSHIGNNESSKNKIISSPISNKRLFSSNEGYKNNTNINNIVSSLQNNTPETLNLNNNKKKFSFNCFQYFLPVFILKKEEKFRNLFFYENFIYKNISIEVIIPLIERMSRTNYEKEIINKKTGNYYFSRMNSTVLNNNYLKKAS